MIEIQNLTARGVTDISLKLRNGKRYALTGDEAGASALLAAVAGCLAPDAGCVLVDGYDAAAPKTDIRSRVGYLLPENPLCTDMTVYELLDFAAEIKGLDGTAARRRIRELLKALGMPEAQDRLISRLPAGNRRLVGVAQALLASPRTVLLDRPDEDLSPRQLAALAALVDSMGQDVTVVVACRDPYAWGGVFDAVITVGDGGSASVEELARRGACVLPDEENQRDEEVESDDSNL